METNTTVPVTTNQPSDGQKNEKVEIWYRFMGNDGNYLDEDCVSIQVSLSDEILGFIQKVLDERYAEIGKHYYDFVKAYAPKYWNLQQQEQLRNNPNLKEYKTKALVNWITNARNLNELKMGRSGGYFIIIKGPLPQWNPSLWNPSIGTNEAGMSSTLYLGGIKRMQMALDRSFKRHPIDEKLIAERGWNLREHSDLCECIIYLFNKLVKENISGQKRDSLDDSEVEEYIKNANLKFKDNCLEFRLDRKFSDFQLDLENDIKVLLGPSGAGKTRKILEMLYSEFGYYFTVKSSFTDFGSRDLVHCLTLCNNSPEHVEFFISVLYFVRISICNHLKNKLGFDKPWMILIAQLHPEQVFGIDIFEVILQRLCSIIDFIPKVKSGSGFPLVAIDEIQCSLEGRMCHILPGSSKERPFFSPLVYYSKVHLQFPHFLVSGTGINFEFMNECLESGVFKAKKLVSYKVLTDQLQPLTKDQVANYARLFLGLHQVKNVNDIVSRLEAFELCHGRARFVAYILDSFLESENIDVAMADFASSIYNVHSNNFPLSFLKRDMSSKGLGLKRVIGDDTLHRIVCDGLYRFFVKGKATLVLNERTAEAIQFGLGFGKSTLDHDNVTILELSEMAIVHCLRYCIPFQDLIHRFAETIVDCPKPQMVGYLLEYLVAYAFVANICGEEIARKLEIYSGDLYEYLTFENEDPKSVYVFLPDNMCGADILLKYEKKIYSIQIKFIDALAKQAQVNAFNTTDPWRFYCNRKTGKVLKGFETKRATILETMNGLVADGYVIERILFAHTADCKIDHVVQSITSSSHPHFFDVLNRGLWSLLDNMRKTFSNK